MARAGAQALHLDRRQGKWVRRDSGRAEKVGTEIGTGLQRTGQDNSVRSVIVCRENARKSGRFDTLKYGAGHAYTAFKTGALNHSATHPSNNINNLAFHISYRDA